MCIELLASCLALSKYEPKQSLCVEFDNQIPLAIISCYTRKSFFLLMECYGKHNLSNKFVAKCWRNLQCKNKIRISRPHSTCAGNSRDSGFRRQGFPFHTKISLRRAFTPAENFSISALISLQLCVELCLSTQKLCWKIERVGHERW